MIFDFVILHFYLQICARELHINKSKNIENEST